MNAVEAIKHLFLEFGSIWVLWLLFALSAASLAVCVERWFFYRHKSQGVRELASALDSHLTRGAWDEALRVLGSAPSVSAAVARAGLNLAGLGPEAAHRGMQSAMGLERKALEARLAYLGTLGNNAPFVGLFGTVIGIIMAFEELGRASAATGAAGASQVASAAVMAAIAEALVATAVGIFVALPAVAAYNYFQRRSTLLLDDAEALSNLILAYLTPAPRSSRSPDARTRSTDAMSDGPRPSKHTPADGSRNPHTVAMLGDPEVA
jgi:biopolymer transport protein ExbB